MIEPMKIILDNLTAEVSILKQSNDNKLKTIKLF